VFNIQVAVLAAVSLGIWPLRISRDTSWQAGRLPHGRSRNAQHERGVNSQFIYSRRLVSLTAQKNFKHERFSGSVVGHRSSGRRDAYPTGHMGAHETLIISAKQIHNLFPGSEWRHSWRKKNFKHERFVGSVVRRPKPNRRRDACRTKVRG
jgi:hypothetical protein